MTNSCLIVKINKSSHTYKRNCNRKGILGHAHPARPLKDDGQKGRTQHQAHHQVNAENKRLFYPLAHQNPILTVHNLSSATFTPEELELLSKGLSFAPTPAELPTTKSYTQLLGSYDAFARSLRQRYVHAKYCSHIQTQKQQHQCTTANIYRRMKFLPAHPTEH